MYTTRVKTRAIFWYRFRQYVNSEMPKEKSSRPSPPVPFPTLQFAEKGDLWNVMTKKESGMYLRDPQILAGEKHSNLQPRMRAILVDWLIEVSEVSWIFCTYISGHIIFNISANILPHMDVKFVQNLE